MITYLDKVKIEDKDILFRLLQYSLFEESEYDLNEMNNDGIFEYKYFESYFKEEDRHAFFIREENTHKILGFAMINTYLQKFKDGHSIAEFMVIPKYRRNKIGKNIAYQIFDMFKGNWEVSPSLNSEKAYLFWKNTIENYTNKNYKFEDRLFLFNNLNI